MPDLEMSFILLKKTAAFLTPDDIHEDQKHHPETMRMLLLKAFPELQTDFTNHTKIINEGLARRASG